MLKDCCVYDFYFSFYCLQFLNRTSEEGLTPVHIASIWGRTSVLHLLLANGGDPWLVDNENKNAFCHAHEQQQWETFNLLDSFKNAIISVRPDQVSDGNCYKLHLGKFFFC